MTALTAAAAARDGNDPIFRLHGEATRRARTGESILNATLGALVHDDGRLAVMPSSAEAFSRVPPEQAAGYAPISGSPDFLDAVIADVFEGTDLAGQAVAVATPGCTGALHAAFQNFLEPGQAALTSSHYWGSYNAIAQYSGRAIATFNMFNDRLRFDMPAFEAGLAGSIERQGRALVLFSFPCHNPTGYSLDADEWQAVSTIVRDAGADAPIAFLLDNAYAAFGSGTNQWVAYMPRMIETSTVLVGWTISKSFAQYGARVGALIAAHRDQSEREQLASSLGYSCRATWSNCNHAGQIAATELLTDPELKARADEERAGLIALLRERVDTFNEAAGEAGLAYPRYDGGFFVSVFTPDSEITAARMRETGVYVLPMPGAVRVALCATPVASIPRLVTALAEGIAAARDASEVARDAGKAAS
ncbi:MAG: aminotransferase class I/II-fold pyridoxal phosphate-dependent enzyme [Gemmatimonadota bacterium]|nr:aminotransferase class I/II-fold pyridoxal phosphate-dependent enzyme [Gemmatimonadota bacterium]